MNVFCFSGNIGKDAVVRHTPAGKAVTSWSVAVKSGFGDRAKTTWILCELWGDRGEKIVDYLAKGQLVGVTGELTLETYEKDGVEKQSLKVNVANVDLLGKRDDSPKKDYATGPLTQNELEDEIPF